MCGKRHVVKDWTLDMRESNKRMTMVAGLKASRWGLCPELDKPTVMAQINSWVRPRRFASDLCDAGKAEPTA